MKTRDVLQCNDKDVNGIDAKGVRQHVMENSAAS
jgi:hypothetical protein